MKLAHVVLALAASNPKRRTKGETLGTQEKGRGPVVKRGAPKLRPWVPKRSGPGTVTKRMTRRSSDLDGPIDLSWSGDGSLSAMSTQHWKDGLWAFDTCNANACSDAKKYLERTQADFVAVQEAKLANAECSDAEQIQGIEFGGHRLNLAR